MQQVNPLTTIINKNIGKLIHNLQNEYRTENNIKTIEWNEDVYEIAVNHCIYQAQQGKIGHDNFIERTKNYFISTENVAANTIDLKTDEKKAEQFMTQWKNSSLHDKNLKNDKVTRGGTAFITTIMIGEFFNISTMINVN